MSMREAGDSAGATGFGAVLDESWAKRLIEPSPIALATSRIRPSEVNGRECMRLSSATTGKSNKTGKSFNNTVEPEERGSRKLDFTPHKPGREMQNIHIR